MTDQERFQADAQLRADYDNAVADLSRCRQQARTFSDALTRIGQLLPREPEQLSEFEIRRIPSADALLGLVKEIARQNDLVGQLRQDLRDRRLAS